MGIPLKSDWEVACMNRKLCAQPQNSSSPLSASDAPLELEIALSRITDNV